MYQKLLHDVLEEWIFIYLLEVNIVFFKYLDLNYC